MTMVDLRNKAKEFCKEETNFSGSKWYGIEDVEELLVEFGQIITDIEESSDGNKKG